MSEADGAADPLPGVVRSEIAKILLWISIGGLVVLSVVVVWAASKSTQEEALSDASVLVFNALLPLFGTWVGAIVAYYFSRENFESASRSVQAMARQTAAGGRLRTIKVTEAMLARANIKAVELGKPGMGDEAAVNLKTGLIDLLAGPVSRVPVFNKDGSIKYIIHESMLYRYSYEASLSQPEAGAFDITAKTLKDFLGHGDMGALVKNSKAFVAETDTLAGAKAAMERVANCKDVFVTKTGNDREKVVGWITNTAFERYAEFE